MNKREIRDFLKRWNVTPRLYEGFCFKMAADSYEAFDAVDKMLREIIDMKSRGNYKISWNEIDRDIAAYEMLEKRMFGKVRPY